MFGRKKTFKPSPESCNAVFLGFDTALGEIDDLLNSMRDGAVTAGSTATIDYSGKIERLQECRSRILNDKKALPAMTNGFADLAKEAENMDDDIAQIGEAIWGYDEARVPGLLMSAAALRTIDDTSKRFL